MLYTVLKKIFYFMFEYLARWQVKGAENIPEEGPVILAANHSSYWDPIVVGVVCPRPVRFMAKKELFNIIILGRIIRALYAFPVDRNKSDRQTLRTAIKTLNKGEVLGLFPEGTRVRDRKLGEFKNGAAMIALRTGAPIVPIALKDTPRIFSKGWFRSFQVSVGKPLMYQELTSKKYTSKDIEKVTKDLREAISNML